MLDLTDTLRIRRVQHKFLRYVPTRYVLLRWEPGEFNPWGFYRPITHAIEAESMRRFLATMKLSSEELEAFEEFSGSFMEARADGAQRRDISLDTPPRN